MPDKNSPQFWDILSEHLKNLILSAAYTVRPIKKFTFRSYGTVSLFNYVRARYAVQLKYRYVRKCNRVSIRILTLLRSRTYRYVSWTAYLART